MSQLILRNVCRLSQVVEEARHGQPQTITLRGEPTAVVVSFEQYQELTRRCGITVINPWAG